MSTTDLPTPSGQDRPNDPTKSQGIAYEVEHVFNEKGKEVRRMPIKTSTGTIWVDVVDRKPKVPKDGFVMDLEMDEDTSSTGSADLPFGPSDRDPNDPTKSQETVCREVSERVLNKDGKEVQKKSIKIGSSATDPVWHTTLDLVEEKPKAPEAAIPDNTSSAGTVSLTHVNFSVKLIRKGIHPVYK